jgi:hypothetical protein
MAKDPKDPQVDPGGSGGQEGAGNGDAGGEGGSASQGDPASKGESSDDPGGRDQPLTPTALQGILGAQKRVYDGELKKLSDQQNALRTSIKELTEALTKKDVPPEEGKKPDENSELVEMRRQLDEVNKKLESADSRAEAERRARLDSEFKTAVTGALVKAGCDAPEEAFLVIRPRLRHDPETGVINATVDSQYGEEDLDLETYIDRVFKEDVLPQVFKGRMRSGGPASGDEGGGGSQVSREVAFDPEAYAKDPDKHRALVEGNRVKGITRPTK